RDYIITVKAKPGYSLERLTVKTGVPERDKDGVVLKTNDDGSVTITLRMVYETLTLSFDGIIKTANEAIKTARVWTNGNNICIETPAATMVQIYTIAGQLYARQTVAAGMTSIAVAQGFYVVRIGDVATVKVVMSIGY
ncbi:MAG: DUF6383 domain-containing protein, partial [Tannerella sp.]|nr:DUF6383 domain-containing protein [Tannerella sp.]